MIVAGILFGAIGLFIVRRRFMAYLASLVPSVAFSFALLAFGLSFMRDETTTATEFLWLVGYMAMLMIPFAFFGAFIATFMIKPKNSQ